MAFMYSTRFVGPYTPLIFALRQELYTQPYHSIRWSSQRNNVSPLDIYCPHSRVLDFLHSILGVYERLPWIPFVSSAVPIRKWANDRAYQLITYEDENTGYQTLGPVSKAFHIVCRYAREGPDSEAFKMHLLKVQNFLWMSKDGLMMTGTDGSQLWDLAFMAQAAVETGLAQDKENEKSMLGMLDWLDKAQIRENPKWYEESYRHRTKGAWPFSTPEQGYVVSRRVLEPFEYSVSISQFWNFGADATPTPR